MPAGNMVEPPEPSEIKTKFPGHLSDHLRTIKNINRAYDRLTEGGVTQNDPESVEHMLEQWRGQIKEILAYLCIGMTRARFDNDAAKGESYTRQAWPMPRSELMPEGISEVYKLPKDDEKSDADRDNEDPKRPIPEETNSQPPSISALPEDIATRGLSAEVRKKRRKPGQAAAEIVLVLQINEGKWMAAREIAEGIGGQVNYNSVAADLFYIAKTFENSEKLTSVVHELIARRGYRLETRIAKARRSPRGPLPREYRLVPVSHGKNSAQ